jgi:hypothetical protein
MSKLRRFKRYDELTVDEIVQRQQAERRGEPEPKFERRAYLEAKADALREFGLTTEADELERRAEGDDAKSPEDMTVDDYFNKIRRNR